MASTRRRAIAALVLACATAAATLGGCSDDGGSEEAFCGRVTDLPPLDAAIDDFAEADTAELGRRLSSTGDAYDELRDAAPEEIRDSVDDVVDLVDAILSAVEDHAEDPEVVADELRDAVVEHPGAAEASARVVAYAEERCDVQLNPMLDDEAPGADEPTPSTDATTSTTAAG